MRATVSIGIMLGSAVVMADGAVDQQAALRRLSCAHPDTRVRTDPGGVTRICAAPFGYGLTPAESAAVFVESFAAALGAEARDLVPGNHFNDLTTQPVMYDYQTGDYKFTLVYFRQQRDGIPVFQSELRLLVRNEEGYPLVWAGSTLKNLGDFTVDPARLAARFNRLEQVAPRMTSFTNVHTVIWARYGAQPAAPRLAVAFVADNLNNPEASEPERWRFVVDADTGGILHQESLIGFADISGSVSGQASTGITPDFCVPEAPMTMPYAQVEVVDGSVGYADGDGTFILPYDETGPATVRSLMQGLYFTVDNHAGDEEVLSESVTPPGPADFMHNADNDDELIRAQVNGYVHANVVRDFCLAANPDYPTIATQTGFLVIVNRDDLGCPGNGWYNGFSINFCRAEDPFPNTAYSSIIHHEYGHHIVETGGSGQMAYGQGMSDAVAVLISDDPRGCCGIFGDCDYCHRTADNDIQYPCYDTLDYCSQLLSGCIWDTRQELAVTEPDSALTIISELTINSVLLHQGTLITPDIAIDFLTLDDDDGMIYNGTPHSFEICNGFGAHSMDCPPLVTDGIRVMPETDLNASGLAGGPFTPDHEVYTVWNMGPGGPITYEVTVDVDWLTLSGASGTLSDIGDTAEVIVMVNDRAEALLDGEYVGVVDFVNTTDHIGDTSRQVFLRVGFNDHCAAAHEACPGISYSGSTENATTDGATTCAYRSNYDVWYRYTPRTDGSATFSLCDGTDFNTVMSIHSDCPGTPENTLACDDNACYGLGPSEITLEVTAGTPYLIRISGWYHATGTYTLNITGPDCPVPGDLDGDGDVDLADLARLLAAYDACAGDPLYDAGADLDSDGCVSLGDLAVLLANYDTEP